MSTQPETADIPDAPRQERNRPTTIKEIVDMAGGPGKLAEASNDAISVEAVYKWPKIGIPDRHWSIVMGLCDVTADELYRANLAARGAELA